MTEIRSYKNSDFSVTVNARLKGIEIVFNDKMTDGMVAEIKDAGFRWSKRQQKWWAYQGERTNAYAMSLVEKYGTKEIQQGADSADGQKAPLARETEGHAGEVTVGDLAELVRQRAELDLRIASIKKSAGKGGNETDVSSRQAEIVLPKAIEHNAPFVKVLWSESNEFPDESVHTIKEFNERLVALDKKCMCEGEGYHKTRFVICNVPNTGKAPSLNGTIPILSEEFERRDTIADFIDIQTDRYDIGDGDGDIFTFARRSARNDVRLLETIDDMENDVYFPNVSKERRGEIKKLLTPMEDDLSKINAARKEWAKAVFDYAEATEGKVIIDGAAISPIIANKGERTYRLSSAYDERLQANLSKIKSDSFKTEEEKEFFVNELKKRTNEWFNSAKVDFTESDETELPKRNTNYWTLWREDRLEISRIPYNCDLKEFLNDKLNSALKENEIDTGKKAHPETHENEQTSPKKSDTQTAPHDTRNIFSGMRHTQGQMRRIREEAKRILAGNTDEEIRANPEMLEMLAQYEGGGGISGEEGRTAAEVLNAFYTPREVVDAVWKLADHYAPDASTVLEPSSGTGRFAENRDGDRKFTLRELDETSARIARILHPKASVIHGAFQEQFFDESGRALKKDYELPKYDLVIGNPPYGENRNIWAGRGEGKDFARLEEYFVSRGIDSLKDENSALVFVMPSGFLKGFPDRAKRILAEKCALVDAYRLPNGAFDTTDVGTDILVLRKGSCSAEDISSDSFFRAHPEKILGEEYSSKDRFGKEVTKVRPRGSNTLKDELNKIAGLLEMESNGVTPHPGEKSEKLMRAEKGHGDQKGDSTTRASEIQPAQFAPDGEVSRLFEENLAWLVETLGCDEGRTRPMLEKLYAMEPKFKTHSEAYERSKAIPLAFGHEHPDAPWVDGEELENIIGIFDERLDYHTVWDRSWAARQGMAREDMRGS